MAWYVDGNSLYEEVTTWEAKALEQVNKLSSKPLDEMDADEIAEWRKWTIILNERSAFKKDVAEAFVADVHEVKHGKWLESKESTSRPYMCSNCGCLYDVDTIMGKLCWHFCPSCGADMREETEDGSI